MRLLRFSMPLLLFVAAGCGQQEPAQQQPTPPLPAVVEPAAHPFEILPDSVKAVGRLASLKQTAQQSHDFSQAGLERPAREWTRQLILSLLSLQDPVGVDPDRPIWFLAWQEPLTVDNMVAIVPLQDRARFLARLGARRLDENTYRHLNNTILLRHHWAVMAKDETVEPVQDWLNEPESLPRLQTLSPDGGLSLWLDDAHAVRAYGPGLIEDASNLLGSTSQTLLAPFLSLLQQWAERITAQSAFVRLDLTADSNELALQKHVRVTSESEFAAALQNFKPNEPVYPALPGATMAQSWVQLPMDVLAPAKQAITADLQTLGATADSVNHYWTQIESAWTGHAHWVQGATQPAVWMIGVRDRAQTQSLINRLAGSVEEQFIDIGESEDLLVRFEHQPPVGEESAGAFTLRMFDEEEAALLQSPWQDFALNLGYAFHHESLLLVTRGDLPAIRNALDFSQPQSPPAPQAMFHLQFDPIQFLKQVSQEDGGLIPVAQLIQISLPPGASTPPITLTMQPGQQSLDARLRVPAESVRQVMTAIRPFLSLLNPQGEEG